MTLCDMNDINVIKLKFQSTFPSISPQSPHKNPTKFAKSYRPSPARLSPGFSTSYAQLKFGPKTGKTGFSVNTRKILIRETQLFFGQLFVLMLPGRNQETRFAHLFDFFHSKLMAREVDNLGGLCLSIIFKHL